MVLTIGDDVGALITWSVRISKYGNMVINSNIARKLEKFRKKE